MSECYFMEDPKIGELPYCGMHMRPHYYCLKESTDSLVRELAAMKEVVTAACEWADEINRGGKVPEVIDSLELFDGILLAAVKKYRALNSGK